jgi:hypothetical protein
MLARVPWIDLAFVVGFALAVYGVALVYVPAAWIVAGLTTIACAVLLRRGMV